MLCALHTYFANLKNLPFASSVKGEVCSFAASSFFFCFFKEPIKELAALLIELGSVALAATVALAEVFVALAALVCCDMFSFVYEIKTCVNNLNEK